MVLMDVQEAAQFLSMEDQGDDDDGRSVDSDEHEDERVEEMA